MGLCLNLFLSGCVESLHRKESKMIAVPQELIVGVDFANLVPRCLPDVELKSREVTGFGNMYAFSKRTSYGQLLALIGVFVDEGVAHNAAKDLSRRISVGPTPSDRMIGDELWLWKAADMIGGTLLFRRINVVIYLGGDVSLKESTLLAERLDSALVKRDPEILCADSILCPEIVGAPLPATVKAEEKLIVELTLANIDPAEALFGTGSTNVTIAGGPRPTLTYYAPDEPEEDVVVLVVSTKWNLMSKKTMAVKVE
jgi:hypothetical protein